MIDKKLAEIKDKLILEAKHVEQMVISAVGALRERDLMQLDKVLENERHVNSLEIEIDELCTTTLALYNPEATYLRKIVAALKNNNDFERMGDQAVNISESVRIIVESGTNKDYPLLMTMMEKTLDMQKKAVGSYVDCDSAIAREVPAMDDVVDSIEKEILQKSIASMAAEPSQVKNEYHIIRIAQNLERIGDLSTNVAQETLFMNEGIITKHGETESLGS